MSDNQRDFSKWPIFNALMRSVAWGYGRTQTDERRDIDSECGYPQTLSPSLLRGYYDRDPIARRVVDVLPDECWQDHPLVYENEDPETETEFEKAFNAVGRSLNGPSSYRQEEDNPVWQYLSRADRLSRIGRFGLILIGVHDGRPFNEPVNRSGPIRELLYIRVFDESSVDVAQRETDPANPRFGFPTLYNITTTGDEGAYSRTLPVHWTRVIHISDSLTTSETLGTPAMAPVFDRLYDLRKVYGASAEGFWQSAIPGISFETHPQLGGDVEVDEDGMKDQLEGFLNHTQRDLLNRGMTAKSMAPPVADPASQVDIQITAICIQLGIPKRVFMGSERGELASSQDDSTWNGRVQHRRTNYLTPRLIVPFIDRLIAMRVLPLPAEGFRVHWDSPDLLSAKEKSTVLSQRMSAYASYVNGGVEELLPPREALTLEFGMSDDEADQVIAAQQQHQDVMPPKEESSNDDEPEESPESPEEEVQNFDMLEEMERLVNRV